MKIGVFGGTFNPIHNGHLDIALKIYKFLSLDKILFMPNKIPPHKGPKNILDGSVRLDMIRCAIKGYDFFDIENYELREMGISYTYKSLEYLHKLYKKCELFFIMGSDSFVNLYKWKNIEKIFEKSNIVVYLREENHRNLIINIKYKYEKLYKANIFLYSDKIIDISSTEIRKMVFDGNDVSELLPKNVYEYIISHKFYKG